MKNTLSTFGIARSLRIKCCPYNNTLAEATFKIFKTEFINDEIFNLLEELNYKLDNYVN